MVPCGLLGAGSKRGNAGFVLHKVREILEQRPNALRAEEGQNVVLHLRQIAQVAGHRMKENGAGVLQLIGVQQCGNVVLPDVRRWEQKVLVFVLLQRGNQVFQGAFCRINFALAVLNKFLQIKSNGFRYAVILPFRIHFHTHLLANAEVVVYRVLARENNRRKSARVYFVPPEVSSGYTVHFNKGTKINFDFVFGSKRGVRIVLRRGLGLRYEDRFDFHRCVAP